MEQNRLIELRAVDPELEVKLAQLQLNRSQTELERARQERKEYLLQAPIDGLVLRVQVQEGDLAAPTSSRPVVWLAPAGPWIVRAEVSQEFAGRVDQGLEVQVEDEASTRVVAKGKIAEVSNWFLPRRQFNTLPTSINYRRDSGMRDRPARGGHAPLRLGQRVPVRILAEQAGARV
jgi:multidrug resistance efflux pump